MKCDEGHPSCQRCIKAKKQCGGYPAPKLKPGADDLSFVVYAPHPSSTPSPLPDLNAQEMRCYDFFRRCTGPQLAGPFSKYSFNTSIWTTIILQAAHSEPAIIHAVIALGALHESFGNHQDPHAATSEYAVQHYNRAIGRVVGLNFAKSADHFDIVLMTCVLFAAFEALRGHYKPALTHIASGANILAETDPTTGSLRRGFQPRDIFLPTFIRLENQLAEIDEKSPGPNIRSLPDRPFPPLPNKFPCINNALVTFDCFVNRLWRLMASIGSGSISEEQILELNQQFVPLLTYFSEWNAAFDRSGFISSEPGVLILEANRRMLQILQNFSPGCDETIWDSFTDEFDQLLDCVEQLMPSVTHRGAPESGTSSRQSSDAPPNSKLPPRPTFTFTLGVVAPLYCASVRCRDPMVRRRALHMLSACNRKEAIWDSAIATRMAERIILIEEAGATTTQVTHASQIPSHARITESSVYFGPGRQGRLIYHRAGDEMNRDLIEQQSEHIVW